MTRKFIICHDCGLWWADNNFKVFVRLFDTGVVKCKGHIYFIIMVRKAKHFHIFYAGFTYTQTIKLCPLDVYVRHSQMYERISFKFSHYQL